MVTASIAGNPNTIKSVDNIRDMAPLTICRMRNQAGGWLLVIVDVMLLKKVSKWLKCFSVVYPLRFDLDDKKSSAMRSPLPQDKNIEYIAKLVNLLPC
ncbi:MAG: hypothetical protein ACJ72Q_20000 [Nitrososphaeraceae archaeon]